jgi:exopolysaccharide production protein ExoZ
MRKTILSLQVYRAIAAIFVVLYHLSVFSIETFRTSFLGGLFTFGFTGVDFFFVLSGFIIFYVHYKDIGVQASLNAYAKRRFVRIYPIYWIILTVKVVVIVLFPVVAKSYERNWGNVLKSYALIPQQNLPVLGVAWTLSYEVCFYLLFGLCIWLGWRWVKWFIPVWAGLTIIFSVGRLLELPFASTHYLFQFFTNERNLEFLLGCWCAYLVLNRKIRFQSILIVLGIIGYALSAYFIVIGGTPISYTIMFGIPSFLLVLGSAALETERTVRWPKALVFLGNASYSIYLTHALFINVFTLILRRLNLLEGYPVFSLLLMAVLAIIGGTTVYQLIERPLLSLMQRQIIGPLSAPNVKTAGG